VAEIVLFHYREGNSIIHRMDVRFKLISLILITSVCLNAGIYSLIFLTLFIALLLIVCRLPVNAAVSNLKVFLILASFVLIARGFTTPGPLIPGMEWLGVTQEGLIEGSLFAWRFLLVILIGSLFIVTTPVSRVKAAVEWFLKPVPFIPSERVGFMVSLTLRFIPVILDQEEEISQAQKARCIEKRKNPFYRLSALSLPLIRKTFERAEEVALAMEARCYSERPAPLKLKATIRDWIMFAVIVIVSFVLLYSRA